MKRTVYFFSVIAILLAGCGHQPTGRTIFSTTQFDTSSVQRLMQHFQQWQGTPYRLGGHSARGIDCSGFVNITYNNVFGIDLPRTTKKQARSGKRIARGKLDTGDLVFFKTGFRQRHVGVYIGDSEFIHASKSQGVIRSSLHSPYWSKHYWKSVRIVDL